MGKRYEFRMMVEIDDEQQLFEAALEHAKKESMDEETARVMLCPNGRIDIEACLIQILDPSTLPGASIDFSDAESKSSELEED